MFILLEMISLPKNTLIPNIITQFMPYIFTDIPTSCLACRKRCLQLVLKKTILLDYTCIWTPSLPLKGCNWAFVRCLRLWAGRDLYRAIPALLRDLGIHSRTHNTSMFRLKWAFPITYTFVVRPNFSHFHFLLQN